MQEVFCALCRQRQRISQSQCGRAGACRTCCFNQCKQTQDNLQNKSQQVLSPKQVLSDKNVPDVLGGRASLQVHKLYSVWEDSDSPDLLQACSTEGGDMSRKDQKTSFSFIKVFNGLGAFSDLVLGQKAIEESEVDLIKEKDLALTICSSILKHLAPPSDSDHSKPLSGLRLHRLSH